MIAPLTALIVWYGSWPFAVLLVLLCGISLYEWFNVSRRTQSFAMFASFGLVYVIGSFLCAYLIRDTMGLSLSLMFLCMVWSSDIGAYFTGKIIGGPKMSPTISPNKTWAGMAGAVFFPALVAVIWVTLDQILPLGADVSPITYAKIVAGGMAIGIFGQIGDLMISFIKRKAGVKDSGNLIPGHGGLLDRIDSMLLAMPVFLVIAELVFYVR